jgi:SAM-dependent methyltransferase
MQQPAIPHDDSDWATTRGEKWAAHLHGIEAMLQPINQPLLAALQLDAPVRIAEIGCGAGPTAIELQRRAPTGSVVHGFDISPGLITLARARVRPDDDSIAFEVADMATAAPTSPYDRLVSRFGVMFFNDERAAFSNLTRWLAPGGRFAFAVWGPPLENPWMASARDAVAKLIEVPQPSPELPGPYRYAKAERLLELLDHAGFSSLEVAPWRGGLAIGGGLPAAEAATFALAALSSLAELLTEAGEDVRAEAHRDLTAHFTAHERGGGVRLDAYVHLVTGARS